MEALARALRDSVVEGAIPVATRDVVAPSVRGYELGAPIGKGRLGSRIYLGTHKALGTSVAIRILRRTDVADWDAARDRFIREARAMQVVHPNVMHVRDFGEESDYVYVVTDLVIGKSLAQRLADDGPLPWPILERFTSQLVDGVAALHRRGAFICGITPLTTRLSQEDDEERLLVSSGGVGQIGDLLGTVSVGALRGTELGESELPYVAPEILMGEAPSIASDLFTIGALVYMMATGSPPFLEPTLPQLMGVMLRQPPEPLIRIRQDVPQAFNDAIMKTLSPVPRERPVDARALALML
jgi:serine/threonine protein kinase